MKVKPGAYCRWRGHILEFVERIPRMGSCPARNIFRCSDFAGLNGPEDKGLVEFSDRQLKDIEWIKQKEDTE